MTEKEKMLAGILYDWTDPELMQIWNAAKNLMRTYNQTDYADHDTQEQLQTQLLGTRGENLQITAPFYVDYGKFIHIGNNCEINMNCVFLDCNTITIGDNTLIAPGVHIYTVSHPTKASERFGENGFAISHSAAVRIGNNVWIGGATVILPGVTIGDNVTIGAGSVVNRSIPSNVLACGNPCRIIKEL